MYWHQDQEQGNLEKYFSVFPSVCPRHFGLVAFDVSPGLGFNPHNKGFRKPSKFIKRKCFLAFIFCQYFYILAFLFSYIPIFSIIYTFVFIGTKTNKHSPTLNIKSLWRDKFNLALNIKINWRDGFGPKFKIVLNEERI